MPESGWKENGGKECETEAERGDREVIVELCATDVESGSNRRGLMISVCVGPSDLCSSLRGPLAPHRRSPGSPPPALGALLAQGEAEGAVGEEAHSPGLSAGSQACKHSSAMVVI